MKLPLLLSALFLYLPMGWAQLALEKDINQQAASSDPGNVAELDGVLYFSADDGIHGVELFRYDPQSGEAELAANIRPNNESSYPIEITAFDGKVFLRAFDGLGTIPYMQVYDPADGTVQRLRDAKGQLVREPSWLFVFHGKLFFSAIFTGADREPGYYDPDTDEVYLLSDINTDGSSNPSFFLEAGGKLWFSANDGQSSSRLWHYDPSTEALTNVVYDSPGELFPSINFLYHAGGKLFFRGHISGRGDELYHYDIATNTLSDIDELYPGPGSSTPGPFLAFDGKVYFPARTQAHDREVMVFDPADGSIELMGKINPDGNSNAGTMLTLDGKLYLTANDGTTEERKLFSFQETLGLKEEATLPNDGMNNMLSLHIASGGKLYLSGLATDTGTELFSFTPGEEALVLAADINQTTIGSHPYHFTEYNGKLYFSAEEPGSGREIWYYDPATGQTNMLSNAPGYTNPWGFTVLDDKLFFSGTHPGIGYGLYYYDDETRQVTPTSFLTPSHSGHISELIAYSGKLYFSARDDDFGNELHVYDPQTNEATLLADINTDGGSNPSNLFVFDDQLFFRADDGASGAELWRYDAASSELSLTADISPGEDGGSPDWFAVYDGELYFSAYQQASSFNIYSYDPVADSLTQRTDISGNLSPEYLTVYDGKLFFKGRLPGSNGADLLYYDAETGEIETTSQINSHGSNPSWLTVFNDKLYFAATTEAYGNELWEYTAEGTAIVADIWPGVPGSDPSWMSVFNGKLYFSANDGYKGAEIWSLASCLNLFVETEAVYHPDSLGSITLSIEGGMPPYTISWSHGPTGQSLTGLPPGEYFVTVTDDSGCLSELSAEVRYIDTTSAADLEAAGHVTVYPNPGSGQFAITWSGMDALALIIFDMQGRQVLQQALTGHDQEAYIDLQSQSPGIYFLQLRTKNSIANKKLVLY